MLFTSNEMHAWRRGIEVYILDLIILLILSWKS